MGKVLFVVPAFKETILQECRGTLLLTTILKEKGMDVDIYRYFESDPDSGFDTFLKNSVSNILGKDPAVVSFYCRGDCFLANILIAKELKALRPQVHIIFGGPQADIAAGDTLRHIPWVDYCCSGEGETTVYPLFEGLLHGKDITDVNGLTYRDANGNVVTNPRPELIKDLDQTPFVDYSLLPENLINSLKNSKHMFMLEVGRGCPFNCAYCSTSLFWQRRFRIKSPQRIIDEMLQINKEFAITTFGFEHDLFTANKKYVGEFCRTLKDANLNFKWGCSSRADTIDRELIEEMASAGLCSIFLGIESGSPRMQSLIHKNLNIEKSLDVIRCLIDNNITVTASFMYGFPEETYDDVELTLQMAYKLLNYGVKSFQFHLCSIFPGTEYYDMYKDKLVWSETTSDHTGDFALQENIDFVHKHGELFPFYYEYRSELRNRLNSMELTMVPFLEMYKKINTLDPQKFAGKRIIDLYLDFKDANTDALKKYTSIDLCKEHEIELFVNFLSTIYDEESTRKLKEIFSFNNDAISLHLIKGDTADIKIYNIDINALSTDTPLRDIKERTSMVYFNKTGKKVTYKVQYMN